MTNKCVAYNKRWFWSCLTGLLLMGVAMRATDGLAFLLIFPLILIAFGKNKSELLLYCLLLDIAMVMSNSEVIPKSSIFSIAARSVYFIVAGVMGLQMVAQKKSKILTPFLAMFAYLIYMALISSVGWMPLISYLKLTLFITVFIGFYSVSNAAATRGGVDAQKLRSIFLAFAIFFIIGSVALIPFPGLSMMRAQYFIDQGLPVPTDGLFKGMALHSQSLGPVVSSLGALLLADLLFNVRKWDKLYLVLLLCVPILVYKTQSRTGMGIYIASICATTFIFMCARGIGNKWKNHALSALLLLGTLAGISLFTVPQLRLAMIHFVLKYADDSATEVSMEKVLSTRQGTMDQQMETFAESPWIGNGFQVTRQFQGMEIQSASQLLSAPVEKGVWVTAVLEEGGVFGLILFITVFALILYNLWSRQAYVALSVCIVMLVGNLGEFSMFSMTSTGGMVWALVFVGAALDAHRLRQQRIERLRRLHLLQYAVPAQHLPAGDFSA